jgi:hypothetical protein
MNAYDLEMPAFFRLLPFLLLAFLTVGAPIGVLGTGGPTFLLIPVLAIAGWNWWVLTTLVHRVLLHDDGLVEWVALVRRVKTEPEAITEIRPERLGSIGLFTVRHASGRLRFVNQITGFHEVVAHIKSRNPSVSIRGC